MLFFGCIVISALNLFLEAVLLHPCFIFSKNSMLSFRQSDSWDIKFSLIFWNIAIVVSVSSVAGLGRLAATLSVLHIWDIMQPSDYVKSSFISQLI